MKFTRWPRLRRMPASVPMRWERTTCPKCGKEVALSPKTGYTHEHYPLGFRGTGDPRDYCGGNRRQ